jgi:hypothetical protein
MPTSDPATPDEGMDGETAAPPAGHGDDYAHAGRTIRHAFADGDDEGLARAICDLVDMHDAGEGEAEPPGKKPNLAMLLIGKKKGK